MIQCVEGEVDEEYGEAIGYLDSYDDIEDVDSLLMYLYMHYSNEVEANQDYNYAGGLSITNVIHTKENTAQSCWNMLLRWNQIDPVDAFEQKRNNYD